MFRKGTVLLWTPVPSKDPVTNKPEQEIVSSPKADITTRSVQDGGAGVGGSKKTKRTIRTLHCDIISDEFWREHPDILNLKYLC